MNYSTFHQRFEESRHHAGPQDPRRSGRRDESAFKALADQAKAKLA